MRRRHEAEPPFPPTQAVWQMAPAASGEVGPDIALQLAEIDRRVQRIASDRPEGSDLNTLAVAVHGLVECIRGLHRAP